MVALFVPKTRRLHHSPNLNIPQPPKLCLTGLFVDKQRITVSGASTSERRRGGNKAKGITVLVSEFNILS